MTATSGPRVLSALPRGIEPRRMGAAAWIAVATRIVARAYLAALSIAGVLSLLVVALAVSGLVRPLHVISDSMAPAFTTGDLLIATAWPTGAVRPGDVVVVDSPRPGLPIVSHRVRSIALTADGAELMLKGDSNSVPDPDPYEIGPTVSKAWYVIPQGAVRYAALTRPLVAIPILGGIAALAVAAALTVGSRPPRHAAEPRSLHRPRHADRPGIRRGGR